MVNIHEYLGEFLVQHISPLHLRGKYLSFYTSLHLYDSFSYLQLFISSLPVLSKFDHFDF